MACLISRYASLFAGADPPVSDATTRSRAQHRTIMEENGLCWAPARQQPPKQNHVLLGASPVATVVSAGDSPNRTPFRLESVAEQTPNRSSELWSSWTGGNPVQAPHCVVVWSSRDKV